MTPEHLFVEAENARRYLEGLLQTNVFGMNAERRVALDKTLIKARAEYQNAQIAYQRSLLS